VPPTPSKAIQYVTPVLSGLEVSGTAFQAPPAGELTLPQVSSVPGRAPVVE